MATRPPNRTLGQLANNKLLGGPRLAFLATIAFAGSIIAMGLLPDGFAMPTISILLFVLAGLFALVAWVRCSTDEYDVTFWDVAGAIALIGIGTAALVEPDQLVRLVAGTSSER